MNLSKLNYDNKTVEITPLIVEGAIKAVTVTTPTTTPVTFKKDYLEELAHTFLDIIKNDDLA